jgi:hypothetical protein
MSPHSITPDINAKLFLGMPVLALVISLFTLIWLTLSREWLYLAEVALAISIFGIELWYLVSLHNRFNDNSLFDRSVTISMDRLVSISSALFILLVLPLLSLAATNHASVIRQTIGRLKQIVSMRF